MEHKCKAKTKKENQWIEGYYLSKKETTYCFQEDYEKYPVQTQHYIAVESMTDWGLPNEFKIAEINPDTLCRCTGKTDKFGKMIFENDIIKADYGIEVIVCFGEYPDHTGKCNNVGFYCKDANNMYTNTLGNWLKGEVVGNIINRETN